MGRNLDQSKFCAILDAIASGLKTVDISEKLGCSRQTIWKLEKEFPLWDYSNKHPNKSQ